MLLDIRTIGYSRVRIERMKKSSVIQCHRCQRLHHTTGQCNFDYRWVQCKSPHQYGNCPRAANQNLPINCAEDKLNDEDHTANDLKNCNYYRMTIEKQQLQQQQKQQQRINDKSLKLGRRNHANTATNVHVGSTGYADAVRNGIGGFFTAQIAELVALTLKGVIAQLNNAA